MLNNLVIEQVSFELTFRQSETTITNVIIFALVNQKCTCQSNLINLILVIKKESSRNI